MNEPNPKIDREALRRSFPPEFDRLGEQTAQAIDPTSARRKVRPDTIVGGHEPSGWIPFAAAL